MTRWKRSLGRDGATVKVTFKKQLPLTLARVAITVIRRPTNRIAGNKTTQKMMANFKYIMQQARFTNIPELVLL